MLYSLFVSSVMALGTVERIEAVNLTETDCFNQSLIAVDSYADSARCVPSEPRHKVGVLIMPTGRFVHVERAPDGRHVYPEILVGNDRAIMDAILDPLQNY